MTFIIDTFRRDTDESEEKITHTSITFCRSRYSLSFATLWPLYYTKIIGTALNVRTDNTEQEIAQFDEVLYSISVLLNRTAA